MQRSLQCIAIKNYCQMGQSNLPELQETKELREDEREKMIELKIQLKSLKHIEEPKNHHHIHKIYCEDDLKQEAIKWMKELESGLIMDSKNNLMFVTNHGSFRESASGSGRGTVPGSGRILPSSITVYPLDAAGDTAPLRVLQGPKTQLNWPSGIAADPDRGTARATGHPGTADARTARRRLCRRPADPHPSRLPHDWS